MTSHDPERWWTQQDEDTAWIARQEARSAALSAATPSIAAPGTPACRTGLLAEAVGKAFPLQVCQSAAGYYIGTRDEEGLPCSRESREYWPQAEVAQKALARGQWTQKREP